MNVLIDEFGEIENMQISGGHHIHSARGCRSCGGEGNAAENERWVFANLFKENERKLELFSSRLKLKF